MTASFLATRPLAVTIEVGNHPTFSIGSFTFNADTMWSTGVAGLVVIGLGIALRTQMSTGVPGKVQVGWEVITQWISGLVEENLGRVQPFVVPLAISLFTFILVSNWLELIPTNEHLPAPTADVNLTYALALFVIDGVHIYSLSQRGLGGYVKHYFQPGLAMLPLNIIEEVVKPATLALRLFGNIFAGGIMISLIGLLPSFVLWAPTALWKLFDMFIGGIQAFIFSLLTIIYFGMAGSSAHAEEHAPRANQQTEGAISS